MFIMGDLFRNQYTRGKRETISMPQQTLRTPHDAFRVGGIDARVLYGDGVLYLAGGQQWNKSAKKSSM